MAINFPAGFYNAKLRWRLTGDPDEMVSTIGLRGNEPGSRPLNEVAEAVFAAWLGAWPAGNMGNGWSFVGVDVAEGSAEGAINVGTWNEPIEGTGSMACLPTNCALLVKKKTALAGRRNTGRMFIPSAYLGEADVSNTGIISNLYIAANQACMTQFYDNLRDSTDLPGGTPPTSFMPVLFHGPSKPPAQTPPVQDPPMLPGAEPTDITSFVVDPMIATQRQRMRR